MHLQSDSPKENGGLMNNLSAEQVINGRKPQAPAPVGIVLKFLVVSGEQFIEINTSSYQHSSTKSLDLEKIGPLVFGSRHSPLHLLHLPRRLGEVCVFVALASKLPISLE